MAIINHIFGKSPSDNIIQSLGNILLSGVENEGSKKLYFNILLNLLRERKTVILVNGTLSAEQHSTFSRFVTTNIAGRSLYDLNLSGRSDSLDILSAFQTSELKAEFIVSMLASNASLSDHLKLTAQRFYLYAISAMEEARKPYRLKDLAMMDPDTVTGMVTSSSISTLEKNRRLRFLGDASTYSTFLDIESLMVKLESSGLLDLFSGDLQVRDMLNDGNVVMLSGMLSDDHAKKELMFNSLFCALTNCLEIFKASSRVVFMIKDADFIAGDYIRNTLEFNFSYQFASCIFVDDITRYIAKNGNAILDAVKSFLVFNQGSYENAAFWSAFFGSRDVQEKSYSYTRKKSWNPFANMMDNGGVIASPRKYNSTTVSYQKVNKPIYRPEVFQELKPDEAMCYLREPLQRKRARIEE